MPRVLLAALLLLAACAGPKPCTRSLCVTKLDGTMDLAGWSGGVRATSESPKPPVLSDSTVTMVFGTAEFRHGKTRVTATEGAAFTFSVSTRAVSSITVATGAVTVTLSSGPALALAPGIPYALPKP